MALDALVDRTEHTGQRLLAVAVDLVDRQGRTRRPQSSLIFRTWRCGRRAARSLVAVGGEKDADAGAGVAVELFGRRLVLAKEHRPIQRDRHDQPVEVLGGERRVFELENPSVRELLEDGGERRERAPRPSS